VYLGDESDSSASLGSNFLSMVHTLLPSLCFLGFFPKSLRPAFFEIAIADPGQYLIFDIELRADDAYNETPVFQNKGSIIILGEFES
jgi:hypothetical protein